jgi:hypothetical protein
MEREDLFTLLLCTVRYSMGRCTYMSSLAPDLVLRYGKQLERRHLVQIADEIEKELQYAEATGTTLGHRCDHDSWTAGAAAIRRLADS